MNDTPKSPPSSAEFIAAEAAAVIADEPLAPLPPQDTGQLVVRGAAWTITGFGVMHSLRFGSMLILPRLVEPYVLGVITTVNLCTQGLHMFSDLGIKQCVVNSPRGDDPRFLNTAWTIQIIRGLVLLLIAALIAWPISMFYAQTEMTWLIPLVALTAICEGFMSTSVLTLLRHLRRGPVVLQEIASYVCGVSVIIIWLLLLRKNGIINADAAHQQMLAFGMGNVTNAFVEMVISYFLIRGIRHRLTWDAEAGKTLFHFSGWIFVSTALTFFANNLDRLYVGKISQTTLAEYHIAAQLARLPALLIATLGHQFLFPLYGNLARRGVGMDRSFAVLHSSLGGFAAFMTAGVMTAGPTFIRLVLPEKYQAAADYVAWLSIAAWFTILQTSSEAALLSKSQTRQLAGGQAAKLALMLPLLFLGHHYFGIHGVIAGYTAAEAIRYVILCSALAREGLPVLRIDLVLTLLLTASAIIAIIAGQRMEGVGGKLSQYGWRFATEVILVTIFWAIVIGIFWKRRVRQTMAMINNDA